tara:strand:- start:73 stop:1452 length:1380 start_codon:yes stop_codon:yes gene_type:complete
MTPEMPTISLELPCSGSLLPTKAEYVQFYNDIAMIPSKLKAYKSSIDLNKIAADKKKQLEDEAAKLEGEVDKLSEKDIEAEVKKEVDKYLTQLTGIEDIIGQVEEFMEMQETILSPWWSTGNIRNWQKEANDAWSELIDEFHIYIPVKMLELISSVVPVDFKVSIMGISVDILKILEKEEQERLKTQITEQVELYYNMVPAGYQYHKGEFGIKCDEWKGKLTWAYFKNEVLKWCTNLLQSTFGALIDAFEEIWDTLGLPSLPALLNFDVETFIREQIDLIKEQALGQKASLEAELERLKKDAETLEADAKKLAEDAKKDVEKLAEDTKKDAQEKIAKLEEDIANFTINGFIVDQLKKVSLFGVTLIDVIGGEIDTNVVVPEEQINEMVRAARDWFAQWQKELINMWINEIKSFLDAIGLGAVLDFLTLTFCDVLKLIGVPMSIDLTLPELPQIDVAVSV